eukprot:CCRYP_010158-RB/>CCRYP_010158-RB protein AED:0.21 eAED:0.21 QI:192/1/1/1/0.75/0.4/5/1381/520
MKHESERSNSGVRVSMILVLMLGFAHASHSFTLPHAQLSFVGSCRNPSNENELQASRIVRCFAFENVRKRSIKRKAARVAMISPAASAVMSKTIASLHTDNSFILTILTIVSACGIAMEQQTTLGKALSAPLVTMLISLCLANVGFIPFSSPVCKHNQSRKRTFVLCFSFDFITMLSVCFFFSFLEDGLVNRVLVPLAVPLFLFDSDLKRVVRDAGSLLVAFLIGAVSTIAGTLGSFALIPMKSLGDQGWKVASALAARHIGGAINFVAVADTLNIDGGVVSAAIAADNVVVALYFAFLFYLATPGTNNDSSDAELTSNIGKAGDTIPLGEEIVIPNGKNPQPITTSTIAYSMATASCLVTVGTMLTQAICPSLSSLVLTSLLTVASATIFPNWFQRLRSSGTAVGILFLQLFFAASGAAGSLVLVLRQAPSLIAFSALQLAIHFVVLVGMGKLCGMNSNELYLASNANVGGPTTAAAMAQAKEWQRLVLPALLVGVLGYAMATAVALTLGPLLIHLAAR